MVYMHTTATRTYQHATIYTLICNKGYVKAPLRRISGPEMSPVAYDEGVVSGCVPRGFWGGEGNGALVVVSRIGVLVCQVRHVGDYVLGVCVILVNF